MKRIYERVCGIDVHRDMYHLEPRVKAHVMVAFPGYALWVTLKHLLQRRPAVTPRPSTSGVENAEPLSRSPCYPGFRALTSFSPRPTGGRSACVE
jgi:hypothetical protein